MPICRCSSVAADAEDGARRRGIADARRGGAAVVAQALRAGGAGGAVGELGLARGRGARRVAPQRDVADGAAAARLAERRRLIAGGGRLVEVAEVRHGAGARGVAALAERRQRLARARGARRRIAVEAVVAGDVAAVFAVLGWAHAHA